MKENKFNYILFISIIYFLNIKAGQGSSEQSPHSQSPRESHYPRFYQLSESQEDSTISTSSSDSSDEDEQDGIFHQTQIDANNTSQEATVANKQEDMFSRIYRNKQLREYEYICTACYNYATNRRGDYHRHLDICYKKNKAKVCLLCHRGFAYHSGHQKHLRAEDHLLEVNRIKNLSSSNQAKLESGPQNEPESANEQESTSEHESDFDSDDSSESDSATNSKHASDDNDTLLDQPLISINSMLQQDFQNYQASNVPSDDLAIKEKTQNDDILEEHQTYFFEDII